jgi:hypothetical protein
MALSAAAKVELDMMVGCNFLFVLGVGCCGVLGAGENHHVCLLRFGVNGSCYLLVKKPSICGLVQNFTSLHASSVQVLCKFHSSSVHVQCKSIA